MTTAAALKTIEVVLPTLHSDQVKAFRLEGKYKAIRCGRRWGKSELAKVVVCNAAIRGQSVGWFTPDYKIQSEAFNEMVEILDPVVTNSNQNSGVIRTMMNGRIDFWTLENERAGRSRRYHLVIIDEAAFTKSNMMSIWNLAIQPTLLDYDGDALVLSNTNGNDPDNFFYQICNEAKHGFVTYHAPTTSNPLLPLRKPKETDAEWKRRRVEMEAALIRDHHPLVYQQEYLAEFVDWSGVAFFALSKLLVNDLPVAYPKLCDAVFAIIDSATKTGKENDGTAVAYCAYIKHPKPRLVFLDWELQQIEGSLLEVWLPTVFKHCEELAKDVHARYGFIGVWIEDKASGMVLLQQAQRRNWPANPIDSKLTSVGKSERAISVSGYVYRDMVKVSDVAYNRTCSYKGVTRNHFISQVTGFRVGNKDQIDDDCLDTFCYGIALSLGDIGGF